MQVAIQVASAVVRAMKEADLPPKSHIRRSSQKEPHRPRQAGPMMSQQAFDRKALESYVELFNSEMEVANILQVKVCDLDDEVKLFIIKNWLGREGLQPIQNFY